MTTVYLTPTLDQIRDDNGIGRVIEAQVRLLPAHGIELVDDPAQAEVIACHIHQGEMPRVDVLHLHGLYWSGDTGSGTYTGWHHSANQRIVEAARRALAITVPSPWVAGPFLRDMRIRPEIIGHGIDLDAWEPVDPVGYILWNKNRDGDVCSPAPAIDLAARGWPVVSTFGPRTGTAPATLQVIGTVPFAAMREYVRHAGIYLATTKETFGVGTLEALAAGVPVLGYRFGGTADLVEHGVTGYLVEPGDLDDLAEGVRYIQKHRAALSGAARHAAGKHTWEHRIAQYAALYDRTAARRRQETGGVSVVITNYNYGEYVDAAITSVLQQTQPATEIIVVDDGSTDGSLDHLSARAEDDGLVVIAQANAGVAAARNAGIAAATQPFIVCLDADDQLAPAYLATCRAALLADRGRGIAYTGLALLNGDRVEPNGWPPSFDWEIMTQVQTPPANCIPCAAMFRRAMWERAGGYKQVYAPAEDTEFWVRGLATGWTAIKAAEEALFLYRVGHDSASHTKEYHAIDTWHPWMRDKRYPLAAPATTPPTVCSYSDPLVSVVIPVGPGHASYVRTALDSLLGQTCRSWEVIVVDDTIRGGIGDVFDLAAYPFVQRVTTSYSDRGHGPGDARNAGLREVRAPLVVFLDADDYLMPTALETMVRAFVSSGGKYIYTDWLAVSATGTVHDEAPDYTQAGWLEHGQHAVTALLPTAWARDVGGFDAAMLGWEDWDFFIKFALKGYCGARVAIPLLAYRQTTGTVRERSFAARDDLLALLRERYATYATGETPMPGCCGGNGDALLQAKQMIASFQIGGQAAIVERDPVHVLPAVVRMEFIGVQQGAVTFFGSNGRYQYRGGRNAMDRYADVQPEDVDHLEATGMWRVITQLPEPSVAPTNPLLFQAEEPAVAVADDDVPFWLRHR